MKVNPRTVQNFMQKKNAPREFRGAYESITDGGSALLHRDAAVSLDTRVLRHDDMSHAAWRATNPGGNKLLFHDPPAASLPAEGRPGIELIRRL